jgi:poly(3-hydroxybutyrate) depolymerase
MLSRLPFLLAFAASALAQKSSGCKAKADTSDTGDLKDLAYDFHERAVLVSYPPKYRSDKPASVIIAFHDREQTPIIMQETTLLSDSALNPKSMVFYVSTKDVRFNLQFVMSS